MKLSKIKELSDAIWEAKQKHEKAVATLVGKIVIVTKGSRGFEALVLRHGYLEDVFIRNLSSGKEYRISSYHISEIIR